MPFAPTSIVPRRYVPKVMGLTSIISAGGLGSIALSHKRGHREKRRPDDATGMTGYACGDIHRGPMVELRTLAYFVTTCRCGSFAGAAAELEIAVSTLSTTLKALGQDLDLTLFRRSNNTLYPTAAARALMRAAEPLLIAEAFARRHVMASTEARLKHLVVDINLSFTIGGISKALRLAIDRMASERADVFVDPQWKDEKDLPHLNTLAGDWS